VLSLLLAGSAHLTLAPAHARELTSAGVLFAFIGGVQILIASALTWRAGSRQLAAGLGVQSAAVLAYVSSRIWAVPLLGDREPVDAVGLLIVAIEALGAVACIAAARGIRPRRVSIALACGGLAISARGLFDAGPRPLALAAAAAAAAAVLALTRSRAREWDATLADATAGALLLRAGGLIGYVALGAVASIGRVYARTRRGLVVAPLPGALAWVLVLASSARLEVLHVGHGSEPWAALVVVLFGAAVTRTRWQDGTLASIVAFYLVEAALQAVRIAGGATSYEAVEIAFTSLGSFVLVAVALADPRLARGRGRAGVSVAILAAATDVGLRQLAVPYSTTTAILIASTIAGLAALVRDGKQVSVAEPSASA
jgi:hypothetical protein